jgi:hypothetical protein
MQGVLAGLLGCVFGVIGIFALGLVFVPLALACALVGFIRGIFGKGAAGIGTSMLAGALGVFGFITSPSLWLITAAFLAGILGTPYPAPPRTAQTTPQMTYAPTAPGSAEAIQQAMAQARSADVECRNMRLSGQLLTYEASAQCSNPRIVEAFRKSGYRYMDLIVSLTAKRLELAEAMDQGRLTEAQVASQLTQFSNSLIENERLRDTGVSRSAAVQRYCQAQGSNQSIEQCQQYYDRNPDVALPSAR